MMLHVFAQAGDELEPLFKEQLRERSGDVATISKQLATQPLDQVRHRSAIIDLAGSQTTRKPLASIIDGQVEFEAVQPAHAGCAPFSIGGKDAMLTDPFGITDCQRSRVNEADAGAGSIATLQVGQQGNQHRRHESHKALITDQLRKFAVQMHLDMLGVIGLTGARVRLMKVNENRHHLTRTELTCALSLLACCQLTGLQLRRKAKHEIIDITKQFEYTHGWIPPMVG